MYMMKRREAHCLDRWNRLTSEPKIAKWSDGKCSCWWIFASWTYLYLHDCYSKAWISRIVWKMGTENGHPAAQTVKNVLWTSVFGLVFPTCYGRRNVNILHQSIIETTVNAGERFKFSKTDKVQAISVSKSKYDGHRFLERKGCPFSWFHKTWVNSYRWRVLRNNHQTGTCDPKSTRW